MAKSKNRDPQITESLTAMRENMHKMPRVLSYFEDAVIEVIGQLSAKTSRVEALQSELESNIDNSLKAFESTNNFKPHIGPKARKLATNTSTSELKKIWTPAFTESFLLLAVLSSEEERVQKIVNHKNSGFPPAMVKRCNEFLGQDLSLKEKLNQLRPDIFPQGIFNDIPEEEQAKTNRLSRWASRAWQRVAGGQTNTEVNGVPHVDETEETSANDETPSLTYDVSDEFLFAILDLYARASKARTGAEMTTVWEDHNRLHTFDASTNLDRKGINTLIQLDRLWSANVSSAELDASHIFGIVFLDSFKLSDEYQRQRHEPDGISMEDSKGGIENVRRMGRAATRKFYEELSPAELHRFFGRMRQHGMLGVFEEHLNNKEAQVLPSFLSKKLEWWKKNKMAVLEGEAILPKKQSEEERLDIIFKKIGWDSERIFTRQNTYDGHLLKHIIQAVIADDKAITDDDKRFALDVFLEDHERALSGTRDVAPKDTTEVIYKRACNFMTVSEQHRFFEVAAEVGNLGRLRDNITPEDSALPVKMKEEFNHWYSSKIGDQEIIEDPQNDEIVRKQLWFDRPSLLLMARKLDGKEFSTAFGIENYDAEQTSIITKNIILEDKKRPTNMGRVVFGSLQAIASAEAEREHKRSHLFAEILNLSKPSDEVMGKLQKRMQAAAKKSPEAATEISSHPAMINMGEGAGWNIILRDEDMRERAFNLIKEYDLVAPFYFLLRSKNTYAPDEAEGHFIEWCKSEEVNLRQELIDYELIDLTKPKSDVVVDLETPLATQLIQYGISTTSEVRNAKLSSLSVEDLQAVPMGERDHAWLAYYIQQTPGYIGKQNIIDAVMEVVKKTVSSDKEKDIFSKTLARNPELFTPPVPALWVEFKIDDGRVPRTGFLLERLPGDKSGLQVMQFTLNSEHGVLPNINSSIFYSVTEPSGDELVTTIYKNGVAFQPKTESDLAFAQTTATMLHFLAALNDTSQHLKFTPPLQSDVDSESKPLGTMELIRSEITLNIEKASTIPGITATVVPVSPELDAEDEEQQRYDVDEIFAQKQAWFDSLSRDELDLLQNSYSPAADYQPTTDSNVLSFPAPIDETTEERIFKKFQLRAISPDSMSNGAGYTWWPNPEGRDLDHAQVRKNVNNARVNREKGVYMAFNEPAHRYFSFVDDRAEIIPANDTGNEEDLTEPQPKAKPPAVFSDITTIPDLEASHLFPSYLSEDEQIEILLKYDEAYNRTVELLLAEADMYLLQALNRGCDQFTCFIDLNKPGFSIHLRFSGEIDVDGKKRTQTIDFTLDNYAKAYNDLGIPLTMENAVDLKIAVQSIILNTEGVHPSRYTSSSGSRSVTYDTQMPTLSHGAKPTIRKDTRGMCSLAYTVSDPYNKGALVNVSVALGMALHFDDEATEQKELDERKDFVIGYLKKIDQYRTPEGFRAYIFKRDVMVKLKSWLKDNNKEWETSERMDLPGFEEPRLIHVFSQSADPTKNRKNIRLASISLSMDVGGENASWNCYLNFYMGEENSNLMGERVHTRFLSLRTRDPQLALARTLETLNGVSNKSGSTIYEGLIPTLQRHVRENGDGWRVEKEGQSYKVLIGGGLELQDALDDMMRYERDIGVKLHQRQNTTDGNQIITLQALRSLIGDIRGTVQPIPEYVYERDDNTRKPVAYSVKVPKDKIHLIDSFVKEVHDNIVWYAEDLYSSVALGQDDQLDKRKSPKEYRLAQIRNGLIRSIEAIYEGHFGYKLPQNWYREDAQSALLSSAIQGQLPALKVGVA